MEESEPFSPFVVDHGGGGSGGSGEPFDEFDSGVSSVFVPSCEGNFDSVVGDSYHFFYERCVDDVDNVCFDDDLCEEECFFVDRDVSFVIDSFEYVCDDFLSCFYCDCSFFRSLFGFRGLCVNVRSFCCDEERVGCVCFGGSGSLFRCCVCKSYVNGFFRFGGGVSGVREYVCNICGHVGPVPVWYQKRLLDEGVRKEELLSDSVDFDAPLDYCTHPPAPPTFVFVFPACGGSAWATGCLNTLLETQLQGFIDEGQERTRVCFLLYDEGIHFFDFLARQKHPQRLILKDLDHLFLPKPPQHFIVNAHEHQHTIRKAIQHILTQQKQQDNNKKYCVGSVLNMIGGLLEGDGGGGAKVLFFLPDEQQHLFACGAPHIDTAAASPSASASSSLEAFNAARKKLFELAKLYSERECSVDFFLTSSSFSFVNVLSVLSQCTGGDVFSCPLGFDAPSVYCGNVLKRYFARSFYFESVFRVRHSPHVEVVDYLGTFLKRGKDLLILPITQKDKSISILFKNKTNNNNNNNNNNNKPIHIQTAVLYTSFSGQRKIRVHNRVCKARPRPGKWMPLAQVWAKKMAKDILNANGSRRNFLYASGIRKMIQLLKKELVLQPQLRPKSPRTNTFVRILYAILTAQFLHDQEGHEHIVQSLRVLNEQNSLGQWVPRVYYLHQPGQEEQQPRQRRENSTTRLHPNGVYWVEDTNTIFLFIGATFNTHTHFIKNVKQIQKDFNTQKKQRKKQKDTQHTKIIKEIKHALKRQGKDTYKTLQIVTKEKKELAKALNKAFIQQNTYKKNTNFNTFIESILRAL